MLYSFKEYFLYICTKKVNKRIINSITCCPIAKYIPISLRSFFEPKLQIGIVRGLQYFIISM